MTVAKVRNSVRQTGASVLKQRDFVTAGVIAVSVVKITISRITVSSKMSHCGDCVWKYVTVRYIDVFYTIVNALVFCCNSFTIANLM